MARTRPGDPGQAAGRLPPRARRQAAQAYRLGEQAATHGVEPIVTTATRRPPLAHFFDEWRAPHAGMGVQGAGREQRIERVENPLLFAGMGKPLDHGTGQARRAEFTAQQGGQKPAQAVGLDHDRR